MTREASPAREPKASYEAGASVMADGAAAEVATEVATEAVNDPDEPDVVAEASLYVVFMRTPSRHNLTSAVKFSVGFPLGSSGRLTA